MSLVLSNIFKDLLLSSYVSINTEIAVKSLHDLIGKSNVQIHQANSLNFISKEDQSEDIKKLKERSPKNNFFSQIFF